MAPAKRLGEDTRRTTDPAQAIAKGRAQLLGFSQPVVRKPGRPSPQSKTAAGAYPDRLLNLNFRHDSPLAIASRLKKLSFRSGSCYSWRIVLFDIQASGRRQR